jgi:hypothetical protein
MAGRPFLDVGPQPEGAHAPVLRQVRLGEIRVPRPVGADHVASSEAQQLGHFASVEKIIGWWRGHVKKIVDSGHRPCIDGSPHLSSSGRGAVRAAPDLDEAPEEDPDMPNVSVGSSPTLEAIAVDPLLDDSQRDLLARLYPACVTVSALDATEGRGR